jgi:histidyl-tRNA synthetase
MNMQRIRGTRDILDTKLNLYVLERIKNWIKKYNFSEIVLPTIEYAELFKKALGESAEAASKELFLVKNIHGEEENMCLRPESTSSTVRAYLMNQPLSNPWKVFTYGSMFRYERPQKGRYREFYQFSFEIIDAKSNLYDLELIQMLYSLFYDCLNISDFSLEINYLGELEERQEYKKKLREFVFSHQSIPQRILELVDKNILRIFDLKDEECKAFVKNAPLLKDSLTEESKQKWNFIKESLKLNNINFYENPYLVRGLDYYNNTIFEFTSSHLGSQNAFCGGGRYDDILKALGKEQKLYSIGASIGFDRLLLILEELQKIKIENDPVYGIVALDEKYELKAQQIAIELRNKYNIIVEHYIDKTTFKSALKKADHDKIKGLFILGEDEINQQKIMYKNMVSGKQSLINLIDLNNIDW